MKCISCTNDINSKMTAALKDNRCPYCGNIILNPIKMKQMLALGEHLSKIQITSDPNTDSLIRDKVITAIIERFDVIDTVITIKVPEMRVATDKQTDTPIVGAVKVLSEKEREVIRAQARSEVLVDSQQHKEIDTVVNEADTEGLTDDEVQQFVKNAVTSTSPKAEQIKARNTVGKGARPITPAGDKSYKLTGDSREIPVGGGDI